MQSAKYKHFHALAALGVIISGMVFFGCGEKRPGGGGGGAKKGLVEGAFAKASSTYKVPVRFMVAAAYLESRLSPENAMAHYVNPNDPESSVQRGTIMTQTAFGITYEKLGLDPEQLESQTIEAQVDAYANWIHEATVNETYLNPNPKTLDDKYFWLDTLAKMHRAGEVGRRNVQIFFAKEMIKILNEGFIWQDPRNGEVLKFGKESPSINIDQFEQDIKQWFELDTREGVAEIPTATFLTLASNPPGDLKNTPKRVVVVHCPLTLSACLELQNSQEDNDEFVHLEAHYVIPPIQKDSELDFARVYQVARLEDARVVTNSLGEPEIVQDAVVVMLVGNSGRVVNGDRQPAIPTWFTDKQLRRMGQMINDVCTYLAHVNKKEVDRLACMSTEGDVGVQFYNRGHSEEYRWGDIADFDPSIFEAYLLSVGGLGTEVAFEFKSDKRQFKAGTIPLTALFNPVAQSIKLERLARCADGRAVWELLETEDVRGERRITFKKKIFDSGPNRGGDQFFRARVFDKQGKLVGWSIDQVFLSKFEEGERLASDGVCK
jgi:hypothetical protein